MSHLCQPNELLCYLLLLLLFEIVDKVSAAWRRFSPKEWSFICGNHYALQELVQSLKFDDF